MRFLSLESGQLGVLIDGRIVDLSVAAQVLGEAPVAATLQALINGGDAAVQAAWLQAEQALRAGVDTHDCSDVVPQAPLPRPVRDIICVGKNYAEHIHEVDQRFDHGDSRKDCPVFFNKAMTAVSPPGAPIPLHKAHTAQLDYEAEVAIIIGQGGCDISVESAWDHVFGYTIINDVSARDLQQYHQQWFRGKSLDGFAPMGPYVVHRSAMAAVEDIELRCWVNDELRQKANLSQLVFDVPTLIARLSAGMTLLSGDIIATGTPAGVGMGFTPPRYLKSGDRVCIEITGAGRLCNQVV